MEAPDENEEPINKEESMETEDTKSKDNSFEDGQIAEEETPAVKVEKPAAVILLFCLSHFFCRVLKIFCSFKTIFLLTHAKYIHNIFKVLRESQLYAIIPKWITFNHIVNFWIVFGYIFV